MAMNLSKITQAAGLTYLLSTVTTGDTRVSASGPSVHDYYVATGTPPGVWLGAGAETSGIDVGGPVAATAAADLFTQFRHPATGMVMGRVQPGRSATVVAGYDFTFRVPKSVSVLFAISDRDTQARILAAHHAAIAQTLTWLEREVVRTRSGAGGVVPTPVRGLIGARYDHWDNRNGDPHLHSHVAVINRVQRVSDGAWLTLDGRTLYRSAVAASEMHENLLLDELTRTLGVHLVERPRPTTSAKSVVLDLAGIPTPVVEEFSSRDSQIRALTTALLDQWRQDHPGQEPAERTLHALEQQAWRETRQPKDKNPTTLAQLTARWRRQVTRLGHDPRTLVAATIDHPNHPTTTHPSGGFPERLAKRLLDLHTAYLRDRHAATHHTPTTARHGGRGDAHPDDGERSDLLVLAASTAVEAVMATRATWTRANVHAEASRLTRHLRSASFSDRDALTTEITDAALARCTSLTPHRYQLPRPTPENTLPDPTAETAALSPAPETTTPDATTGGTTAPGPGSSSSLVGWLDDPVSEVFTHDDVLDAEAYLHHHATTAPAPPGTAVTPEQAETALTASAGPGPVLAPDQHAAAVAVTIQDAAVSALVGPAGSGKTSTVRAIRSIWEHAHGPGTVLAVATAAKAAAELTTATGIPAITLAKLLYENTPDQVAARHGQRQAATRDRHSIDPRRRAYAARVLTGLDALEGLVSLHAGQLVVVDEASMTGTFDLAQLVRLAQAAGAKVLLVGDPHQLDAPAAGGFLGWLDRTGHSHHLHSLWRFTHPWEAQASLRLRDGDPTLFTGTGQDQGGPYAQHGRIHTGIDEDVLQDAHGHAYAALQAGKSVVLVAATNEAVTDMNTRATLHRRAQGLVTTSTGTVPLRVGMAAGTGDVVLLRRTDRRHTDTNGRAVANGDQATITHISPTGTITLTRTGGSDGQAPSVLHLPAAWLAENAELGYATTAHRAQGITVDEAHLVLSPTDHLTRELLYVALTRGRDANHAWVATMDAATAREANHAIKDIPTPAQVLTRALVNTRAEHTAHETRDSEHTTHHSLARLLAEHDHLALHTHQDSLAEQLCRHHPQAAVAAMQASPAWDCLVTTWSHAHRLDPVRARWLTTLPLTREDSSPEDGGGDHEHDGVGVGVHEAGGSEELIDPALRLRRLLDRGVIAHTHHPDLARDPLAGLHTPSSTSPPGGGNPTRLLQRCEELITDRVATLRTRVVDAARTPLEIPGLTPRPPQGHPHLARWEEAALAALVYTDTWQATLLEPTTWDERRTRHHARVQRLATHWNDWTTPDTTPRPALDPSVDPHADHDWDVQLPETWTRDLEQRLDHDDSPAPLAPERAHVATQHQAPARTAPRAPHPTAPVTVEELFTTRRHTDRERHLTQVLEAAWQLWQHDAADSWVPDYLASRGLPTTLGGWAPPGWTTTLDTLRHDGFTTQDLHDAGLLGLTRDGRPIDRFRDRLILPIRDAHDRLLGFTARTNPRDTTEAPKYLNTPTTTLFHKAHLLHGLDHNGLARLNAGATPVIVEGALDAAAIHTLRSHYVPLAPCGTALTPHHLASLDQLAPHAAQRLILAFDGDHAGHLAAARTFDLLPHRLASTTRTATLPPGLDPADLIRNGRANILQAALDCPVLLYRQIIDDALHNTDVHTTAQALQLARSIAAFTRASGAVHQAGPAHAIAEHLTVELGNRLSRETIEDLF